VCARNKRRHDSFLVKILYLFSFFFVPTCFLLHFVLSLKPTTTLSCSPPPLPPPLYNNNLNILKVVLIFKERKRYKFDWLIDWRVLSKRVSQTSAVAPFSSVNMIQNCILLNAWGWFIYAITRQTTTNRWVRCRRRQRLLPLVLWWSRRRSKEKINKKKNNVNSGYLDLNFSFYYHLSPSTFSSSSSSIF